MPSSVVLGGLVLILGVCLAYAIRQVLAADHRANGLHWQLRVAIIERQDAQSERDRLASELNRATQRIEGLGKRVEHAELALGLTVAAADELPQLRERLAKQEAERQAAEDTALDPEQARALLEEVELPDLYPGVKAGTQRVFDQQKCQHCGGIHARACPRVRRLAFGGEGKPTEVEFWPEGRWPADQVLWLEDVIEAAGVSDE